MARSAAGRTMGIIWVQPLIASISAMFYYCQGWEMRDEGETLPGGRICLETAEQLHVDADARMQNDLD
jgi:hypothetical protein